MAICQTYEDFEWVVLAAAAERTMSDEDRRSLKSWESEALNRALLSGDGSQWPSTSEWPEWERIIGRPRPLRNAEVVRIPIKIRKASIPVDLRWEIFERDEFTCKKCGTRRRLTIDHIIAESKGGLTTIENLQTLCHSCNSRKGAR